MLQLNEKWRINADRYNWILEHRRVAKATGVEMWYAYSYHNSLPQAINKFCIGVLKNKVNKTNIDLEAFLKAIEDLKEVVNKACENIDQDTLKELTISENKKKSNSKESVVYDESDDDDNEPLDDDINEFVAKMEGE